MPQLASKLAPLRGVLSPVLTPFTQDLSVDVPLLAAQCQWLLDADVGLAVFGTNSEGTSLSGSERSDTLHALIESGIDPLRLMPGTGGCSVPDVVAMSRMATHAGVGGVLVLPPFYYKGVSDDGLFGFFDEVIQRVGDSRLRLYLYHIPPVTQVPLSVDLIERLLDRHGPVLAGIKDSGGDWSHTQTLIERFAPRGFAVFAGNENFLLQTMRAGGAGCISATANINPAAIADLYRHWQRADADQQQARLDTVRAMFARFPLIPAMKSAVADATGLPGWRRVRPPLLSLPLAQQQGLRDAAAQADFALHISYRNTAHAAVPA
jgi:4-hydroxy-tetrahydrodipicolinate synthase